MSTPDPRTMVTRPDGRPEAYDLPTNIFEMECEVCMQEGHRAKHPRGKVVMASPIDTNDGHVHFVCVEKHVPANIVIFDPATGTCRDKTGQNVWKE